MIYQKIYNNWKYEPDIFTYPISPLQNNFLPIINKTCCCILAGSINCYYCQRNHNKTKVTTKIEDINE